MSMPDVTRFLKRPARALRTLMNIPSGSILAGAVWRSLRGRRDTKAPLEGHIEATYRWLCAAQDSSDDGGVAAWFDIKKGWVSSYPETTGYIIPSFLAFSQALQDSEARERALRMADWEIEVQLPSGAVLSSQMGVSEEPAVFNTGQVIFGWTMAFRATGQARYAEAAAKAASWLVEAQDEDGVWRRNLSGWTSSTVQTYNVRAAWALAQAGVVFDERPWVDAALKNCEWTLTQQDESGWYANNSFRPGEVPLLHTICYVIEGLFGVGLLLDVQRFVESARRATDALLERAEKEGRLHGRYGPGWRPGARWRCLTGDAQLAGILLRFARYVDSPNVYRNSAEAILRSVCALQDMNPRNSRSYGGVAGSQPVWGEYLKYRYLNWAAKFHLDCLLLLLHDIDPHGL